MSKDLDKIFTEPGDAALRARVFSSTDPIVEKLQPAPRRPWLVFPSLAFGLAAAATVFFVLQGREAPTPEGWNELASWEADSDMVLNAELLVDLQVLRLWRPGDGKAGG